VRVPTECYQLMAELEHHVPSLDPVQRRGLALWICGAVAARSACQSAVETTLLPYFGSAHAVRQYLREWLYDGADRAHQTETQLDVEACFAELLGWVVEWWQGTELPLAIDATLLRDRVAVLSISVLYRGSAIPVAWKVLPANQEGAWVPEIVTLLAGLVSAVPRGWTVLVAVDRGLWSPRIWQQIRANRWHPLMRLRGDAHFAPLGQHRRPARALIAGPGKAWVGDGTAFKAKGVRLRGTLMVVWGEEQAEPWVVLTDLAPDQLGIAWYGLRVWIELGFRALKRMGWHWERTRRTTPLRVARHWLVMAVATLLGMADGSREEDAEALGVRAWQLRTPPPRPPRHQPRSKSVFGRGMALLGWQLLCQRRLWRRHWLLPEAWPEPPPGLTITIHLPPAEITHA
jgi:hypothetical protein